jgi:type II secretory pathway component PulK
MRTTAVVLAAMLLVGCGSKEPVKRQPGSWRQTIRIVRLEGKGLDASAQQQMQQMFDLFGKMTVCVTPEQAAKEDVAKNMEKLGASGGTCTVEKQTISGETVDYAATCKQNGETVRIAMAGTSGATKQDMTIKVEPADQTVKQGMELRVIAERRGDCTANDVRVPDPAGNATTPAS